jgi:hypothetical protein
MSWVPIVGSGFGNIIGGMFSDYIVTTIGIKGRVLVPGIGNILAIPFVLLALTQDFPMCFVYLCISGFVGECYLSQSFALLSEISCKKSLISSVAIFMFLVTMIAGNMPLLIPYLVAVINDNTNNTDNYIYFYASPPYSSNNSNVGDVLYKVISKSDSLLKSLEIVFSCCYIISSVLYFICYFYLQKKET